MHGFGTAVPNLLCSLFLLFSTADWIGYRPSPITTLNLVHAANHCGTRHWAEYTSK